MTMTVKNTNNRPPKELGRAGAANWREVTAEFFIEYYNRPILLAMCQQLDIAHEARKELEKAGLTTIDRFGQTKANPLVEIARQADLAYARLRRELNLEAGPDETRPPRLPGKRL
jgi:phage terminase small subunit